MNPHERVIHDLNNKLHVLTVACEAIKEAIYAERPPSPLAVEVAEILTEAGFPCPCLHCGGSGRLEECGNCAGCLMSGGEVARFGGRKQGCGGPCPACGDDGQDYDGDRT